MPGGPEADEAWERAKRDAMCLLAESPAFVLCCLDEDGKVTYMGCGMAESLQMMQVLAFANHKTGLDLTSLMELLKEQADAESN